MALVSLAEMDVKLATEGHLSDRLVSPSGERRLEHKGRDGLVDGVLFLHGHFLSESPVTGWRWG
jgi:hypothetical protein